MSTVPGRRAMQMLLWTRTRACNGLTRCNRSRPTAPACSARPPFPPGAKHGRARAQPPSLVVTKQECRMRLRDMRDMSPTTALWRSSAIVTFLRLSYEAPATNREAWRSHPGLRVAPSALQPHLQARRRGIPRAVFRGLRRLHSRYAFSAIGAAKDSPADQKALLRRSGA